jgi:ABC-type methionine transport system ATPase subunit
MTAEENVSLPMILSGTKSRASIDRRSKDLLTRVGLAHRMDHLPSQLSGGEQQRVTIARAIANKPQLLLLDEPTGDLDTVNGTIILGLLLQLNRHEGITCVMVTHDQSLKHYANRVVHMVDGKILRIEEISAAEREKADTELQEKVDSITNERQYQRDSGMNHVKATTEFRDTHNYYDYIKQQPSENTQQTQQQFRVLPGVTATVSTGTPGTRPIVSISTNM